MDPGDGVRGPFSDLNPEAEVCHSVNFCVIFADILLLDYIF